MKRAFSTLGCPGWTFEEILTAGQSLGYDGIELRGIGDVMRTDAVLQLQPAHRAETARLLREAGLTLCCIDCSAMFANPAKRAEALAESRFAVDAAAELKTPYIRVFGDRITENEADCMAYTAAGIAELCAYAAGTGVTVLLETHGDFNTIPRLTALAERVNRPEFGLIWDVEHTATDDVAARAGFLDVLYSLIRHVHMKDRRNGTLCRIGEGDLPLHAIYHDLQARGYDGFYSLEWEKRWHPELVEPDVALRDFAAFASSVR